jgi:hypothetical protein
MVASEKKRMHMKIRSDHAGYVYGGYLPVITDDVVECRGEATIRGKERRDVGSASFVAFIWSAQIVLLGCDDACVIDATDKRHRH